MTKKKNKQKKQKNKKQNKTKQKTRVGKSSFHFTLHILGHTLSLREVKTGILSKKMEAGADAETTEQYCLQACSACSLTQLRTTAQEWH